MVISVEAEEQEVKPDAPATNALAPDANNPLNAPRVERPYSKSEGDFIGSVPEPEGFGQGASKPEDGGTETFSEAGAGGGMKPNPEPTFGNEDLPPNEKSRSANDLAFIALEFYCEKLPEIFRWWASPNEKKLNELSIKGEVDFNLALDFHDGKSYTIAEYFQEVKTKIEQGFTVDEKWKEEFKPHLIRFLKQKDWGVSTEQVMLWMLIQDLGSKTMSVLSLKNDINNFTEWAKQATVSVRANPQAAGARPAAATGSAAAPPESYAAPVVEPSEHREDDIPLTPVEVVEPDDNPFGNT